MPTEILHFKPIGKYRQAVKGESNYQEHLARAAEDEDGFVSIDLFLEDHNKFDKNAVAIVYETDTVGYLSRADAIKYRDAIKALNHPDAIGTCPARVIGGGEDKSYGIVLDLDLNDLQIESISQVKSTMSSAAAPQPVKTTIAASQPPQSSLRKFFSWFFVPGKDRVWRIIFFILLVIATCFSCTICFGTFLRLFNQ